MTTDKDMRKLIREAEHEGWVFTHGARHIKGRHPDGRTTTISVSPSCQHAVRNAARYLKRR